MREIDFSSPLGEEDEAHLRSRLPNEQVDYIKAKAAGAEFVGGIQLSDPEGALAHAEGARDPGNSADDGAPEVKTMGEGDDPADFTVDQVNAYLEMASDEEVTRVLEAESAGEARKGILG